MLQVTRYLNQRDGALPHGRRHAQNVTIFPNFEFHDYFWSQHKQCIQMSTDMPGIGKKNREKHVTFQKFEREKKYFYSV